jgi:hypothetical protein
MGSKIEGGGTDAPPSLCLHIGLRGTAAREGVPSYVASPNGSKDFRVPPSPWCDWIPLAPAMSREGDGRSDPWCYPLILSEL